MRDFKTNGPENSEKKISFIPITSVPEYGLATVAIEYKWPKKIRRNDDVKKIKLIYERNIVIIV